VLTIFLVRTSLWIGLLAAFAFNSGRLPAQAPLAVVHTWGDLQNSQKMTVAPTPRVEKGELPPVLAPVTFQVGIQSDKATSYSGLVLYFLAPTSSVGQQTPESLGLYRWEVVGKDTPRQVQDVSRELGRKSQAVNGTTFYAEAIPFPKAGDYVVKLVKPVGLESSVSTESQVLAQVAVRVRDHPEQLWYPLWESNDSSGGADSVQNADGSLYAVVPVSNPEGGAAVPTPPRPWSYANFPAPIQPLPVLIDTVADQDPDVHLAMTDTTLVVNFDPKIEGFFPDDNFLTRWWINGKLVELDPNLSRPEQKRALGLSERRPFLQVVAFRPGVPWPSLVEGALNWFTKEVHFQLDFQPDRLGAKKGDQIGLQMLFCPDRFERTGPEQALESFTSPSANASPLPVSFSKKSNRIDFTYSGDPKHPLQ
jgi:hypothetical protein